MKGVYVSVYNGVTDNVGTVTLLGNFLGSRRHIDRILQLRAEEDAERRAAIKKSLPMATISGVFQPKRSKDNLVQHSGYICVDIDGKDNPDMTVEDMRVALAARPYVAYAALSVGGNGMFGIIPLAYPERHEEQFDALKEEFLSYGVKIDASCRDTSRLRILSYDPCPYENENALSYCGLGNREVYLAAPSMTDADGDLRKVKKCVDLIVQHGIDITSSYDEWMRIGAALTALGDAGRYFFHEVSKQYSGYRYAETNKKYDSLLRTTNRVGLGTFFYWCQQYGITYRRDE